MKVVQNSYLLQADAALHTADVRGVSGFSAVQLLTASRDNTAQLADLPTTADSDTVTTEKTFVGHTAFVNFALHHPSLTLVGGAPCVVTGSNDNHVGIWNLETAAVEAVLDGHGAGVCCGALVQGWQRSLTATDMDWEGDIVTGDWAGMLIVFDHVTGRPKQTYAKHKTAIRGVGYLPHTDFVVSASGDKTIHQWNLVSGATVQIYEGHKDVVQCLCVISSTLFCTGSNDCQVCVWRVGQAAPLRTLHDHSSLVYTVSYNPLARELLTASEDHTVKVWRSSAADGEEPSEDFAVVQSIEHPCVVWTVAALPGTDTIVTGGADGVVRVWTRDEGRAATEAKRQKLADAIASQAVDIKVAGGAGATVGGMDVANMPLVDEIHQRVGTAEGERLFARNEAGEVELYVWGSGKWSKVGVVVAGPEQQPYAGQPLPREKKYHNGKAYDYVFDVEVEGRSLKLPYNVGDSVIATAQSFMVDHAGVVAGDSLEEIVQFIMQNIRPEDIDKIPGLGGTPARPADNEEESPTASAPADDRAAAPWDTAEELLSFNAPGAQKKINDLTHNDGSFADVVSDVEGTTEAQLLSAQLLSLYEALPKGSRFPALDIVRYVLLSPRHCLSCRVELLHCVLPTLVGALQVTTPLADAEAMVALRLSANVLALLLQAHKAPPQQPPAAEEDDEEVYDPKAPLPSEGVAALQWLLTTLLPAQARSKVPAVTKVIPSVVRNVAVVLTAAPGLLPAPLADGLVRACLHAVSQLLLFEAAGSPSVPLLLRSLVTLLQPANRTQPWYTVAAAEAKKSVLSSTQAAATGADRQCHAVAQRVLELLQ